MLDAEQIKKIIPHREPFLFLDEIVELVVGQRAVGVRTVRKDEYFLDGHFPAYPVMPGVLVVEALAQVGAVALLSDEKNQGKLALFAGIDDFRFRKEVQPEETLRLEVEIIRSKGSVGIGTATATVGERVAASGRLMFALKKVKDTA